MTESGLTKHKTEPPPKNKVGFWVGSAVLCIFAVLGLALLGWGAQVLVSRAEILQRGETVPGVVVRLELDRGTSDSRGTYHPVVRYETDAGETITLRLPTGSRPPAYSRGERVKIVYLPDAPERAVISGSLMAWLMPVLMVAAGAALFSFLARGIAKRHRRVGQRKPR